MFKRSLWDKTTSATQKWRNETTVDHPKHTIRTPVATCHATSLIERVMKTKMLHVRLFTSVLLLGVFENCHCSVIVFNTFQNPLTHLRFLTLSLLDIISGFSNFSCTYVTIILLATVQLWSLKLSKPRHWLFGLNFSPTSTEIGQISMHVLLTPCISCAFEAIFQVVCR